MTRDVIVVGASSAGLYAAIQLARAGKRVAVFEQAQEINPARRTLIVTPHLRQLLPSLPANVILHHIRDLVLTSPGAETRVTLRDPDWIVERRALILHLAEQARAAGVEIVTDRRFRALSPQGEAVQLEFQNSARERMVETADAVIAADGVFSDVALALGLRHPPSAPILQAEIELPKNWDPAATQVWFDTNETRFFYWLIPESAARAVVGLVGDARAQMKPLLQRFMARHGLLPLAYQGARIAMYEPGLRVEARAGNARVLLLGDAAGQVKVTTVGGTVSGFLSAAAAARALVQNTAYARTLRAVNGELKLHWRMRAGLDRFDNAAYDDLIRGVTPRVREFLSAHNRDEMADALWQLPLSEPRTALLLPRIVLQMLKPRASRDAVITSASDSVSSV